MLKKQLLMSGLMLLQTFQGQAHASSIPKSRAKFLTLSTQTYGTGGIGIRSSSEQRAPSQADLPEVTVSANGLIIKTQAQTISVPTGNEMADRFLWLWWDLHNPKNAYFSRLDVPYHAAETLIVEAPDNGHMTTSEGMSYWVWLEAMFGRYTGDYSLLNYAFDRIERFAIPNFQPNIGSYQAQSPATYARENPLPEQYPSPLESWVRPGIDPIANDLRSTYGDSIYGMHWLIDTSNWYGYGSQDEPTFINTFQRGRQESVWETVPHPSIDDMRFGAASEGFLSLFTQDSNGYKRQWRYSNAPDADARLVQATYWAKIYAEEQGHTAHLEPVIAKASKMGDFLRYSFFDKYFKTIGCHNPNCTPGQGYDAAHYLLSWYYAWGGSHPQDAGSWSWRIGGSHAHFGYQNPLAAFALAQNSDFQPKSAQGAGDWKVSLSRQLEFYRWLQSAEGAIAGGATNSIGGRYESAPQGTSEFYGLSYESDPVYADPGSNTWFGWQAWSMQRVADYYAQSADASVVPLLDRWVTWVLGEIKFSNDGSFLIPSTLEWTGQPFSWNPSAPQWNSQLHVRVTDSNQDVGIGAALAKTLMIYAKASERHQGVARSEVIAKAKGLLDRLWLKGRDERGLSFPEIRKDYARFLDPVYVPNSFQGKMPSQALVKNGVNFLSLRPQYRDDPDFAKVETYLKGGEAPTFHYHRFWAQVEAALAYAEYDRLIHD